MAIGPKRQKLIEDIQTVMADINMRMTVRQIYYQLVSKHIIPNNLKSYKSFDSTLTLARKEGDINPGDILDTSKPVLKSYSCNDLSEYLESIKEDYKRSIWPTQDNYVEVWLEKDALRRVFRPITDKYDCYLVIGKGYQSYSNLTEAANRFDLDKYNHILYFGDCDPTGKDIPRNIEETLSDLGVNVELHCIAITPEQIKKYQIPPIPTKLTDTRRKKFVKEHGDQAAELDALSPKVLKQLIENSILEYLDLEAYEQIKKEEEEDKSKLEGLKSFDS